jgi:hypothetical protein
MRTSELQGKALDYAVAKCKEIEFTHRKWRAFLKAYDKKYDEDVAGGTPRIALMRCYVAAKLGDEIEIPEELK